MNTTLSDFITSLKNIDKEYYEMRNVTFNSRILEFNSEEDLKN